MPQPLVQKRIQSSACEFGNVSATAIVSRGNREDRDITGLSEIVARFSSTGWTRHSTVCYGPYPRWNFTVAEECPLQRFHYLIANLILGTYSAESSLHYLYRGLFLLLNTGELIETAAVGIGFGKLQCAAYLFATRAS